MSHLAFLNLGCSVCKMNALDKMILRGCLEVPGPMIGYLGSSLNHANVKEDY